jgi:hypothetical protein
VSQIDQYVARAAAATLGLLDVHYALAHAELEARIAEASHVGSTDNIDPHHITSALRELNATGQIQWDNATARGGQHIATIQPTNTARRATKIAQAAARKRLLFARYNGWAQSSVRYPQGLIGPAGERAVRTALAAAGTLRPAEPDFGETRRLLGMPLNGPVDSAGYLVALDKAGLPSAPITVLVEVKNIRSWIYPNSPELYQVLDKAATLQERHPERPILPVLACRRAHKTTFWMASQLGFMVIAMERQFVDRVDTAELLEVRNELHFQDLHVVTEPAARVRDRFRDVIPDHAAKFAATWALTCADLDSVTTIHQLRYTTDQDERADLLHDLRARTKELGGRGGW